MYAAITYTLFLCGEKEMNELFISLERRTVRKLTRFCGKYEKNKSDTKYCASIYHIFFRLG